jgi:guanosine-3',5'-bis(diphosphate) 3'-pyrophosphohydrolase
VSPAGLGLVLRALAFAAQRHRDQRRRDGHASPFVNHPIEVVSLLADVGGVSDTTALAAAVLHDVVEDTATTADEIESVFGAAVARIVAEVTDDPALPRRERRRLQVVRAASLSPAARLIKIADKTANLRQMPSDWTPERRADYAASAQKVVDACRGTNAALERLFDEVAASLAPELPTPA